MRLFDVQIQGQTPLLMKRKVREFITKERLPEGHPLREYIKGDTITAQDQRRVEVQEAIADYSAYKNGHGLYMPAFAVRHSLVEGARKAKVKNGRSGIWRGLQGTMFPSPAEILVTREGKSLPTYDLLKDSLVRGSSGVVLQFQAQTNLPWDLDFQLLMLDDNLTEPMIEDTVNGAGLYAGIGAWVSGGFGRFRLSKFKGATLPKQDAIAGLLQPA